jgi:NAD(P)-dependent dehydrogenase (short-subunit alcohol dehydrogenase family)
MATVITGAGSGIGAATRARLQRAGKRVVGIDLRGAEITADLAKAAGRALAAKEALAATDGKIDGLVLGAGIGPAPDSSPLIVSVNYFGAVTLMDRLFDALKKNEPSAAVAITSNSATTVPSISEELVTAMLEGDEGNARWIAESIHPAEAYAASKLALSRAVRRRAPEWASVGVRLNAVAPGSTKTPLLDSGLADPELGPLIRAFPVPIGGFGKPEQIASVIDFLLSEDAGFVVGAVWFVDGGTDSLIRKDAF